MYKSSLHCHMCIGRDPTTGAQTGGVSDSQSKSYGRSNSYSGWDNPRSYPQPAPTTPTGPITPGQTIVLSQHHITPYENTGEGDLSEGDDGGGTIELGQSSVRVSVMSVRVSVMSVRVSVMSVGVNKLVCKNLCLHICLN